MIKKFAPKITGKRWGGFSRFPNLLALEIASTLTRDFQSGVRVLFVETKDKAMDGKFRMVPNTLWRYNKCLVQ